MRADAALEHRVEFSYGILGQLSDMTHFFFARVEIVLHPSPRPPIAIS